MCFASKYEKWAQEKFGTSLDTLIKGLEMSPSSEGYIQGAISELEFAAYLQGKGYKVFRIKEKPAGGFDEKKPGYKGDFLVLIDNKYYVIECKGIKTNAEFRGGDSDSSFEKNITRKQAISFLKKFINIDKDKIYKDGLKRYQVKKLDWEQKNPGKTYPAFHWSKKCPGPDSPDLTTYFPTEKDIKKYVENLSDDKFSEESFRAKKGVYVVLQTHKPSKRLDPITQEEIAAPLISDFSILAVDLFQRIGKHKFVFANPDALSHSPTYPNHLYQNYIIDVLIPGIKDSLSIVYPWYEDLQKCILETNPRTVTYDESQLDHR